MYELFKPALFMLPPENAHTLALHVVKHIGTLHRLGMVNSPLYDGRISGPTINTPFGSVESPLGLAAGCDKNGEALFGWQALGFSFVEVGTVTPLPQLGNPKPRVFRFPTQKSFVNRLGFNNKGAFIVANNIRKAKAQGLRIKVGGNIGKNKDTLLENAIHDYLKAAELLAPVVDYLVINVSSPNTPGLRELQSEEFLEKIVAKVIMASKGRPIFVKVAPDQFEIFIDGVLRIVKKYELAGVICGNTLNQIDPHFPKGGLSGQPLFDINLNLTKAYAEKAPELFLMGVGGIGDSHQAQAYLNAGAKLCQVYTGFVYGGPDFAAKLISGLRNSGSKIS